MSEFNLSRLEDLAPDARKSVEDALKRTLETELARAAAGEPGGEAMSFSRSKGFFFSRSKTGDTLRERVTNPSERAMLEKVDSLDDEAFSKFAERLTTLRDISKGK
ncbi:hypothetical protein [Actinoplanes derwentensis]|uniref:Uncharacterized protein n=1 Tax=Actinoplanes derwentensis TaxID=113562 RepID=A0A1H1RYV5_9ACTN|nr:hypothetical protein [Actinoplanes derwentensis]GID84555.1 hypothetical protein Ade03nite_34790 [Actinoplanes derwentensis]SDS40766.1 hypothetical protein SAMN04489716_0718 [Actinoplanes derwentensis]